MKGHKPCIVVLLHSEGLFSKITFKAFVKYCYINIEIYKYSRGCETYLSFVCILQNNNIIMHDKE